MRRNALSAGSPISCSLLRKHRSDSAPVSSRCIATSQRWIRARLFERHPVLASQYHLPRRPNSPEKRIAPSPIFTARAAAELVALFDAKFPNSPRRAGLRIAILEFYAASGESEAVIKGGKEFLANFPNASERTAVALLVADAYSRTEKPQEEFRIYDSVLQELAAKADRIPLGARDSEAEIYSPTGNRVAEGEESERGRYTEWRNAPRISRTTELGIPSERGVGVRADRRAFPGICACSRTVSGPACRIKGDSSGAWRASARVGPQPG